MTYFKLGTYSWTITTKSQYAQQWFDRGLAWVYGYNHEEAIVCFEQALKEDPACPMARWGIAYAIGPNYNRWWFTFSLEERVEILQRTQIELPRAITHKHPISPLEVSLIEALLERYPTDHSTEDFAPYNDAYADAMRRIYQANPDNLDVCALFVEALMNRTPWQLWDLKSGDYASGASTEEILVVMNRAFETQTQAWAHAGLLHLYIHTMEMSPYPERALRHGDALGGLIPDSGHLWHMPTHIDVLCGNYQSVVERNQKAIDANARFYELRGGDNFYTYYRLHDYHFKAYGAMFQGQREVALAAAEEMTQSIPESVIIEQGDFMECYYAILPHVRIRFGMWREILEDPLPQKPALYNYTTATLHYARTVAMANLQLTDEAEAEKALFYNAFSQVTETRRVINNSARDVLAIAEQMMLGELEYHKGNHELAFDHLRNAIRLDDALEYDEPWGWMQPARHALGALLMEQGQYEEAERVYRADLGLDAMLSRACQHPGNVWSLRGLLECLELRGDTVQLPYVHQAFELAAARAEMPVKVSCFCRRVES